MSPSRTLLLSMLLPVALVVSRPSACPEGRLSTEIGRPSQRTTSPEETGDRRDRLSAYQTTDMVSALRPACPEGRLSTEIGRPSQGTISPEETGDRRDRLAALAASPDLRSALAGLKAFYLQRVEGARVVGSSFALVQDGKPLSRVIYGMADRERNHAVTDETIYHWASITKTFTAIAIMQLRDRGKLSLDDPAVKFIPELREVHDPFGDISEVTIRRLMSHSAGFRSPTWPWGGDKPWHPFEPTHWSQLVAMLPYTEVEFRPGSRYSYSNPGIIFLGRIIELLSGDDYEVYVDKNILKPLGMLRTYFDATPYYLLPHRSASYYVAKTGELRAAPFDADTGITVSNGGLNAPIGDMLRYLDFLLGTGDQRAMHEVVLKRASLEEMFVPQIGAGTEGTDRVSIGLNFFVEERAGYHLVGHSGSQNAFISHFYICPALRAGYIVNFNTQWETPVGSEAGEKVRQMDTELRRYILEKVFPALKEQG